MAVVYRARDGLLGRTVAVKVLREQFAGDSEFVARFRLEARAAASLSHPNVVNIFDVGEDGGLHFIVMEFVKGDRKSTRLNSSHVKISYAVFCLKKKTQCQQQATRDLRA